MRDRLAENGMATRRGCKAEKTRRVYYLSQEFLPGCFLEQSILDGGGSMLSVNLA